MPEPPDDRGQEGFAADPWRSDAADAPLHLIVTGFPAGAPRPAPIPVVGHVLRAGRRPDNEIVLPAADTSVAQQHAEFRHSGGTWRVVDQSVNGTYHNDRLLRHEASGPLSIGDRIGIGETVLAVQPVNPPWDDALLPPSPDALDPWATPLPVAPPPAPPQPAESFATLLDAFLAGFGPTELPPGLDPVAAMRGLGESTRALARMLVGLSHRRPPRVVRLQHRHPPPSTLNPLKMAIDEEEVLLALLGNRRPGCLTGPEASRDVCDDLSAEAALLDACHARLAEIFAELAPEVVDGPRPPLSRLLQRDGFRHRYATAYAGVRDRHTAAMDRLAADHPVAEKTAPLPTPGTE